MNKSFTFPEDQFVVFAFLFYSDILKFDSLFSNIALFLKNNGVTFTNPLSPVLSLIQHSIFLLSVFFLANRWKSTLKTMTKDLFLWAVVGLILVSFLWSDFPSLTQRRSLALLETTIFGLYLASNFSLKNQVKLLGWAMGIALILNILFILALPKYGIEWVIHVGAWKGVFVQKNILARLLVLSLLPFLLITSKQKITRYWRWLALSLSMGAIVMSQSISSLVIAVILLLALIVFQSFSWRSLVTIPFLLSIFLVVGGGLIWILGNADLILAGFGRDMTLSGRTIIWSALIEKIQEQPWLGYGYLGFWHGIYGESAYVGKAMGGVYIPPHAHNGFLTVVLELGAIGIFCFSLSFFQTIRRAFISAYQQADSERLFPLMYLSFLVFFNSIETTLIAHNSIFWVLYVALALSSFIEIEDAETNIPISDKSPQHHLIFEESN